jgi:hypothetical protein
METLRRRALVRAFGADVSSRVGGGGRIHCAERDLWCDRSDPLGRAAKICLVMSRYPVITVAGDRRGGRVSADSRTEAERLTAVAALIRQAAAAAAVAANEAAPPNASAAWLAQAGTNVEFAARHQRARLRGRYGQWPWVNVILFGGALAIMVGCVYGAQALDLPRWGIAVTVLCGQIVVAFPSVSFAQWLVRWRLRGALPPRWPSGADEPGDVVQQALQRARELIGEILAARLGIRPVSAELLLAACRHDVVLSRLVIADGELCGALHTEPHVVGS